jgi:NAD(P)-dependent dehydrogenase (short-subunit alcohol dehydrogenase family)
MNSDPADGGRQTANGRQSAGRPSAAGRAGDQPPADRQAADPQTAGNGLLRIVETLESWVADPALVAALPRDLKIRFMSAAGRLSRPAKLERLQASRTLRKERQRREREAIKANDRGILASSGIREARQATVFAAPPLLLPAPGEPPRAFRKSRSCYVCKADFTRAHHFYDDLCPDCADFNYAKRFQTAELAGRTAYITGARLKIGYQAALKMLRAGARVVVSTRFPHDAAKRYAAEPDFSDWGGRLRIHGLDLRHTPSVEIFCRYLLSTESRLDALLSNAAQTVRRPVAFYRHLLEGEALPWSALGASERRLLEGHYECLSALGERSGEPASGSRALSTWEGGPVGAGLRDSARLSQVRMLYDDRTCGADVFPSGRLDADLQQVDLRTHNTWRMSLAEVPTPELLEVLLINAVAPFVLAARLKPLLLKGAPREVHVVNVSAMEGVFSRGTKTDKHPHTNMAKAALNMMTRTSAPDYARDGIWMNSVDTGWVTDEDPVLHVRRKREEHGFEPPLDVVDGAARILDPWFAGLNTGIHVSGQFLKDYRPSGW